MVGMGGGGKRFRARRSNSVCKCIHCLALCNKLLILPPPIYLWLVELHFARTSGEHQDSMGVLFQLETMRPTGYCRWSYRYWPKNQHTAEKYVQLPPLTDAKHVKEGIL